MMSADSWDICPRCERRADDAENARMNGNAIANFGYLVGLRGKQSLREDYEIGIYNNEFYAIYRGECKECGWKHTLDLTQPLDLGD